VSEQPEKQQFEDRSLKCRDCKVEFKFGVKDQEFYQKMGFKEPKRCRPCREALKAVREGK